MRYTLQDGILKRVKWVVNGGYRVSNPSDAMVDELGAGMVLVEDTEPEYDPETQVLEHTYTVDNGRIVKTYTVTDVPADEPDTTADEITELQMALAEVYEMLTETQA